MPHILFVFIDGVGLGPPGDQNPFARLSLPAFEALAGGQPWTAGAVPLDEPGHVFRPLDANLGVDGLPQSGTGQATLFTGINCAAVAGRHFGPYPHSKTRPVLAAGNVFSKVKALLPAADEPAAFANAYPPRFFTYARRRDRWTVTTHCCLEAGVRVRTLGDLRRGTALAADLTGAGWDALDLEVEPISEGEAGACLHTISRRHAFTLFEYFHTDKAGHSCDTERAAGVLHALHRFFATLLERTDRDEELLLITSDHGNLEDLSVKSHTRHPVPLIAYGRGADAFRAARAITDVTPAILRALAAAE